MLKRILTAFMFLALGWVAPPPEADAGERILSVYTWQDYFSPDVIARFEKAFNCQVEFTYYESNETMVETMRYGGYDIVTPSAYSAQYLRQRQRLATLDHSLIPNLKNIDPDTSALTIDSDMQYSVPFTVTVTGVAYNASMVSEDEVGSWGIFANPRLAKKMAMLNDTREVIGAALKYLGYSVNSMSEAQIREAGRTIRQWKNNLTLFSVEEARDDLRNGKLAAIQTYSGEVADLQKDNPDIRFYVPREGASINSDQLAIGHGAENVELAHAFINFLLDPEIAALNMEGVGYLMPNRAAKEAVEKLRKERPAFNVSPELLKKSEVIINLDTEAYDLAWEEVLIG